MIDRQQIKTASRQLAQKTAAEIDATLTAIAEAVEASAPEILRANQRDLERMDPTDPRYDRLSLTPERISGIAQDC